MEVDSITKQGTLSKRFYFGESIADVIYPVLSFFEYYIDRAKSEKIGL